MVGIKLAINKSKLAGGIFIDLNKVFDKVNYKILLAKLYQVCILGTPKLTNRHHYVKINNNKSNLRPISCGVPQCSAFDPLLFILYINDLENCC